MDDNNNISSPLVTEGSRNELQSCLEDTIEQYIGDFGWSQLFQVVIVSFVWIFDSQQAFISIFTDAQPQWHCVSTLNGNANTSCSSDICLLPESSWSWDLPLQTSIVSEWSLQCAGSMISGMPASAFYMGSFAGGFVLVGLADSSFGRKNTMLLSCLVMSLAGLLSTVSTNIWVYSIFRFVSGFGRANIRTCSIVLSSELVGKRWRGQTGTAGFFMFTAGFLSLPLIAYLNKESSWRVIYLWTCTPAILYCFLVYLLVKESPRWLFVQGRKEDFVRTLKSIAPTDKADDLTLASISNMSFEQKLETTDVYYAIKKFFERKWAIRRLMTVMILGFGVGLVYFGNWNAIRGWEFKLQHLPKHCT
ncbi:organic cation/carnitine transporter 3-like [Daucus carota subsp. sativus]|uniref:Major facilitator superfamily (MFS) profile domain-containing protein n=1 Tax=Daucus carota subsp. sativus TaxID=79200 RepID=A0A166A9H5_DAUCS